MKLFLTFILALLFCFVTVNVYAGNFGLSPYVVNTQVIAGQSTDVSFTVSGFNGVVEISSEALPAAISPRAVDVYDGSRINLTLSCSSDVSSGEHHGTLVFLAKSGNSVQSGIRVPCTLVVNGGSQNTNASGIIAPNGVIYSDPGTVTQNKTMLVLILSVIAVLLILGILFFWRKTGA